MKWLKYIVLLFVFFSCKNANTNSLSNLGYLANKGLTTSNIKGSENKSYQQSCDYITIKKEILSYKNLGIASIPIIENIIKRCIGSLNESDRDSLFILFNDAFYNAANSLTDSLGSKHFGVLKKLEKNVNDSETKDFKKRIDICGLSLLTTEGIFYVDAKSDYFYDLFKGEISPALDEFLKIRSKEMKQGYSEDAGLLISFADLYKHVIIWEDFRIKYPDFFLNGEAQEYYDTYLSTFLTGMDNTRTFDLETQKLLPEMKKLYEKIIARNESRKSTTIISDYYELLNTKGFQEPDDISKFLKSKGLYSMLGVQPDTR